MSRRKRKPSMADYKELQRNTPVGVRHPLELDPASCASQPPSPSYDGRKTTKEKEALLRESCKTCL